MQIDVSFERWKQLTALLQSENDTYDEAIGRLLGETAHTASVVEASKATGEPQGVYYKDLFLPNGTKLRATYKGRTYFGSILDGQWIDNSTGQPRSSPSQAAYSITGGNVNGWLFWLVKRPHDADWQSLNVLRVKASQ
jgi:hypothetical protein